MSMTVAYLKATQTPVIPIEGKSYRVIGCCYVNGAIYEVEKIEGELCFLKGYLTPSDIKKLSFYNIN